MDNLTDGLNNGLPDWAIKVIIFVVIIISLLVFIAIEDSCDGTWVKTMTAYKCIEGLK